MTLEPIAYFVFNRPRHTARTFAAIREHRPQKLFIIADGPRPGHPGDVDLCREVRDIVERVDWPCEVAKAFAESNLGLKHRVGSGLDWVFSSVDRAIVLEDDCLPHPDFFHFCENLLERYTDEPRVWAITGNNFQDGRKRGNASYFFSKYSHCWGWATWRRAWLNYSPNLEFWPTWQASEEWERKHPHPLERRYWRRVIERVRDGELDSWASPWNATVWFHGGLTATPNVNLVTNIGFGPDATHTFGKDDREGVPSGPLGPLTHPNVVQQDTAADLYTFMNALGGKYLGVSGLFRRISVRMSRLLRPRAGASARSG